MRHFVAFGKIFLRAYHCENVCRVQAVADSRPDREIDNILPITIKFTLEAHNRTRVNTSFIFGHDIEKAYCLPYKAIIGKWPQSAYMYM